MIIPVQSIVNSKGLRAGSKLCEDTDTLKIEYEDSDSDEYED